MAKTPTTTQVQPQDEGRRGLVLAEGMDLAMIEADAGDGVDDMSVADVALPYLYILQSNSPPALVSSPQYIEGATAGMVFNNVSQEVYEARRRGFLFLPCYYERKLVEWVDRDKGGGWVADYDAETSDILRHTVKNDKGKPVMRETGNFIVETAYHYGLFLHPEDDVWGQCVMPLKSTALRQNKKLNNDLVTTKIPGTPRPAPRWLFPYKFTTATETKGNNSWFGPRFDRETETVGTELYKQAKEFRELVKSGVLRRGAEPGVGDPSALEESHADESQERSARGGVSDDEIPF